MMVDEEPGRRSRERRIFSNWIWVLLAALALWWPGRLSGPLDGIPFDAAPDAILLGLVFPALCWFHRPFLNDRRARALVVALLAWKAVSAVALVQDGWCVSMMPSRPYVRDQTGRPHSWDVRADWRSPNPLCTAIMTRAYTRLEEFPVWFFNLPPADAAVLPLPEDGPPKATVRMTVNGTLTARRAGRFQLATSADIGATTRIDGQLAPAGQNGVALSAGSHAIAIDGTLTGNDWRFTPLWNGEDMWGQLTATVTPPSALDGYVRPWARWAVAALAAVLLIAWAAAALARVADVWAFAWILAASGTLALVVTRLPERWWHLAVAGLAAVCLLPLTRRMRNAFGAFLLIGVPWMALVVVAHRLEFGRMTLYVPGNDWWTFQRYAYRIFLQGYWLEGGQKTFWFQPLYRWIAGALHLVFGDSTVGEEYWDGACLIAMALFSFHATKVFAGPRWGLVAAALTLGLFMAGPGFIFVGHGLSEISSAGFIYLGALFALRSRHGSWPAALAAGVCATLGIWTRLNNLPMAMAVCVFAWPIREPMRTLLRPAAWFRRASVTTIAIVLATVSVGLLLFALRTWHYTGVFSLFYGTQGSARRVWQPGTSLGNGLEAMFESLMVVLTTTDPPRIHNGSIPLIAGVVVSVAAVTCVGVLGELPFGLVLFCLASLAGALVVRGSAYSGRFSIHIIGAATTVLVCGISRVLLRLRAVGSAGPAP
jgi:hypothetical protein